MPPINRPQFAHLHEPARQPCHIRIGAWAFCHVLVGCFHLSLSFFRWLRGSLPPPIRGHGARIVLTGTFYADNWIESLVRPLGLSRVCGHIWIVADQPFVPMEHVSYVCPPRWLQRLIGRTPARSVMFVITAARVRADIVGGFHLLCNGLLALSVARMIRARAMYFCVGGWAEFVRGGVHGGNRIFTMIGRDDRALEQSLLRAIRQFDLILTMGTGAREFIRSHGVTAPVEVVAGATDPNRIPPRTANPQYDLITVSRLVPVKRLDLFLDIVRRISEHLPTVSAVIVGDGEEMPFLRQRALAMGLADRVHFTGRVPRVEEWLVRSRVFVLTSDSEGLSLALIEAAMAGLPAVVSDVGDLGDLIQDGVNGYRLPPRRTDLFAERLVEILSDPSTYARFADAARSSAMRYSIDATRERWDHALAAWQRKYPPGSEGTTPVWTLRRLFSRKRLWELSRTVTRRYPAGVLSVVPPGVWLGRKFRRNLDFVRRASAWTPREAEEFQLRQLQSIVSFAFQSSAYYRNLYREHGFNPSDLRSLDDVTRLPTTDPEAIRSHLRSVCTIPHLDPAADYVSTGGTGGKPIHFYIGADRSAIEYAHLVASWQRSGYELGLPMAVLRGAIVRHDTGGLYHEYDPFLRHHYYSTFHMTDENMRCTLEHISTIGPCFLHVYPSSVAALARFVRRSGMKPPSNIRGIIAESEIVYEEQRHMVEQVFECRYFSCYGHSEKLILAAECEHSNDYHVWPSYGFFELLDEQGRPITTPGERGEIVGTGFINRIVPFIRYRTGDFATYVGDHCPACGRYHVVIRDIRGHRTQEVLIASDGAEIPWAALNVHDETFHHVRQFQFHQDTPGRAVLRIVPATGFTEADSRRILDRLDKSLGERLHVDIQLTDTICLTDRGKVIYVDQRIPRD